MTEKNIQILQVITGLGVGGAERVVLELSKGLKEQVGIAYLVNQTTLLEQYQDFCIPLFYLNLNKKTPYAFFLSALQLSKIIRKNKVKLLHAHMFHSLFLCIFVKIIFNFNVKIVFTSHNFKGFNFFRSFFIWCTKPLRRVDIIFSKNQHPILNKYVYEIIPNGVQLNCIKYKKKYNDRKIFITIGRLEEAKNHIDLISAFSKINSVNSELWIVGEGKLRNRLEDVIRNQKLESRVFLLGRRNDTEKLLKMADCFVLSSLWEGMPMVILEAGMAKIPIISTNVGVIPDILTEDMGYCIPLNKLSNTMDYLVNHYDEALQKADKFHCFTKTNYSVDVMISKHKHLYKALN